MEYKNVLVSIILPVYNGEKYLSQSIESCLNQTHRNIELIIVNDCSTDNTLSIIETYKKQDSRIRIINNIENKKLPVSLNIGHKLAKGNFLTWTSDDNIYLPSAIEVMVYNLIDQKVDFVYANFIQINSSGEKLRYFELDKPEEILWKNIVGACFMYSQKLFQENIGYDKTLFMIEDYDFWLRAFMKFKFFHIKTFLYKYRIHNSSLTKQISKVDSQKKIRFDENRAIMYKKNFNHYNFPDSLQNLIIDYQTNNKVDSFNIIKNLDEIREFYMINFPESTFNRHWYYLKDKYIKGVRSSNHTQNLNSFYHLIRYFNSVMTKNDYKTAFKILTRKILNK